VAVAAAEIAVLLLRPRTGLVTPAAVDAADYFTPAQIRRGADYANPQIALYGATLVLQAGALIFLIRRGAARLPRRAIAAGAVVSLALTVVTLPVGAIMRQRGIDVGLVTQSWGGWAGDVAKSAAIGAVLAGLGAGLASLLARRFGRRWWLPGTALVVLVGAGFLFAGPVVLDPLFNTFTPLPAGKLRSDVLRLADEAGVKVGQVYEMDASRRTTASNAYVTGLGSSKRVVIYDTLIRDFPPEQTRLVVAHELGHVHYSDVAHGLLYLLLIAPFGVFAVTRLTEGWSGGDERRWIPALALALGVVSLPITMVSNQLSRDVEARADAFALRLGGSAAVEPFIGFQRRITVTNVGNPEPPAWLHDLLGTHPTAVERIGIAKAYAKTAGR
ncbi:MAG: family peptidase, partial [Solirubrobacterales bacterium]|nr:family peptidase [Solirubrobacterales bacterium]